MNDGHSALSQARRNRTRLIGWLRFCCKHDDAPRPLVAGRYPLGATNSRARRVDLAGRMNSALHTSAPCVAQNLTRGIVPRQTGHPAAGMCARAAHVEALERPAVIAMSKHRPGGEKLIERQLTVKDVAIGQAKLAFQIQWGKRAPRDHACAEAGS